ncbi:MAG: carboxypeptidase regulatory-like protein [Ferruginibacter sp.]|nr:carboxypeptidase regulatory-like protein [Ferruginibacter sp.]
MKLTNLHTTFMVLAFGVCNLASAQLTIDNAQFTIQSGATVTVQGDVTSNTDILGAGTLQMNGSAAQNLNMNGFSIPNLEINNPSNVTLTSACKVGTSLLFTNGKILLGTNNFTLADVATISGQGAGKFVETNGSGQLLKSLTTNVTLLELPVGAGTVYRPAYITTSGTYSNASVGVRLLGITDPNKPPMISDFLTTHWPVTKTGVTGTVTVTGQYADADISGIENNLRGYYFNGTDWSSTGEAHDIALNRVSAPIATANGDVFGMDKFILSKTKAFLQAAYNSTTGVMADNLRTPTNLIPLSDPYRTAPYSTSFTHVSNGVAETASAGVFADQASSNNNIVDWVFLELRNNTVSPGNTVLQTRSALLQRNGDIVDVDGTSPVTFNNMTDGNYTLAIRHRNHIGISADPATNLKALSETKSTATILDLTTAPDANLFGPATAYGVATDGKNILWAGNANSNANVRYVGLSNDKDYIVVTTLANNATQVLSNVYNAADVNMNRNVRYVGLSNDKDLILVNILANTATAQKIQSLPN